MVCFPALGALLGYGTGLVWRAARGAWDHLSAGVLVATADVIATGGLHLDGLADAADGLGAHLPTSSRLEIMAEPQIGAYGALGLALALSGRIAAFANLEPSPGLLAGLWCASRSLMVLATRALPYARGEGLVTAFLATPGAADPAKRAAAWGVLSALGLAWASEGPRGLMAVVAGLSAGTLVLHGADRRLGGFTGDVLGAMGVVCETVGLLAACWRRQ